MFNQSFFLQMLTVVIYVELESGELIYVSW